MEQSILSEYGVIGSLLVDPTLFPEASGLSEDDFTLVPLREVFRAMRRQFAENGSFDALTVRAEAGQHCPEVTDKLLLESMEITPTTANLTVYVSAEEVYFMTLESSQENVNLGAQPYSM